jgi:hypothetical protein
MYIYSDYAGTTQLRQDVFLQVLQHTSAVQAHDLTLTRVFALRTVDDAQHLVTILEGIVCYQTAELSPAGPVNTGTDVLNA